MVVRKQINVIIEDYPELNGLDDDEIKEYIQEHYSEMGNLHEDLRYSHVIREKITDESSEIKFY